MQIKTGQTLRSLSSPVDDYFYNAIVCLVQYDAQGALGFVVNRRFARNLNELVEFVHLPPFPLYEGGPVDEEHLYFIHKRPDVIEAGTAIAAGLYFGGNFPQATEAIAQGRIGEKDLKIFVGYCGWNSGDFETEMENGGWSPVQFNPFS